jgi:FAD dependent oxidoreductase TIGR03364
MVRAVTTIIDVDAQRVVIVGGGVLGTMHAHEACRRGWEVTHLEADAGPRRASVRNFGLIWVSGRAAGPELDLAIRARELWEQIAGHSPAVGFRPDGSLTLARHDSELALMAEAAGQPDAARRGFELLDRSGVRSRNPAVGGAIVGGLLCRRDAVVEPGRVLGTLRVTLEATGRYRWLPRRQAVDVETSAHGTAVAIDHLGDRHEGDALILCIGDRLSGLGGRVGAVLAAAPLRRCRLQMMQTAPFDQHLTTALADADSMRYYPAFDLPGRERLPEPSATASGWGMQLLVVQRAAGGLTIGDTHAYDEPFDFALVEDPSLELLGRAERLLGAAPPPVARRWEGVYAQSTDGAVCVREELSPDVWMVTGPGGRGMTCAPAIAADTLVAAGVSLT